MFTFSTTPRLCPLPKVFSNKRCFSFCLFLVSQFPLVITFLESLMPRYIGRWFSISFPGLCVNSVSLQVSLRQKYLLFWLMSENQKNTNVVNGLVENKLLVFPLGKQTNKQKKQLTWKKKHFNEIAVNRNYDSSFYEMSNIRRNNIKIPKYLHDSNIQEIVYGKHF